MTSKSHPAAPADRRPVNAIDWASVTARARTLRAAYLGGLLRNALAALAPHGR